jgi:hypothetical protein
MSRSDNSRSVGGRDGGVTAAKVADVGSGDVVLLFARLAVVGVVVLEEVWFFRMPFGRRAGLVGGTWVGAAWDSIAVDLFAVVGD